MAYTAPQIATILLKADKTMYKIGQIAYENMFAEDNEALDYERDVIFIYKKAVEYADDFFVGTEKLDKVVERLATKISAYDYGVLNPIYADAATINTPVLLPGSALNDLTDVTISNLLDNQLLRYNAATGQWINVGPGAAIRNSQAFTATAGQTVFTTSYPFDAGLFDLYVNGVKLNSLSYTTMGEYQITLNDPCIAGDIVDVVIYDSYTGINPSIGSLNDLTDVSIGALANNQALYYNSATGLWQNGLVFVPYTGATASVDLGEFEIRAGQFTLDTSPTGTATVGTTRWNDSIGSSETTLKGGSVILKNGVDLVARVVNKVTPNTTLTKASYAAVRISGAQGQRLAVAYAQANNDANSADTIGLVTETIATNQEGFIMTMGSLEGINTTGSLQGETWADGDVLYLSPTVPGRITNVKPTGLTGHIVVVGYVEYAHANNGKIYVKTMNGWELDELHNVNINTGTLANGDVLKYNSTTQLWENGVDAGGITGTGVAGQVPYFTGSSAVSGSNNLFWDNANGRLGIGTNAPSSILDIQPLTGSPTFRIARNGGADFRIASSTLAIGAYIGTYSAAPISLVANSATVGTITSGGNFILGVSTDNGQRLQVYGDTLLRGSGNTSATNALTVQNSDSTVIFRVRNNAAVDALSYNIINNGGAGIAGIFGPITGLTSDVFNIITNVPTTNTNTSDLNIYNANGSATITSGTRNYLNVAGGLTTSSGTGAFNLMRMLTTINQTGGANGITRGLYIIPTLTAAADWRSIEWSNNTGWGLYGAGTANSYFGGSVGIGATSLAESSLRLDKNITGATVAYGILNRGIIQSDVTSEAYYNRTFSRTAAASFTLSSIYHYVADQALIGAGSTVTNQYGFLVQSSVTGATNNYGFYGNIASGTGRWNLYMNGTADNYMAGSLGIGSTTLTGKTLVISKNITGSTIPDAVQNNGVIQSDVTNATNYFITGASTVAASFTLSVLRHYIAVQGTFGAGSTVTNQYGFFAHNSMTGATNNYGFYGGIASGTGRWNLYMEGNADNYLAGNLGIGITPTVRLHVSGDTILRGSGATSATTALTVQNSASAELMSISNDAAANRLNITGSSTAYFKANQTTANRFVQFGSNATTADFYVGSAITSYIFTNNSGFGLMKINTAPFPTAGGNVVELPFLNTSFAPTSGTAELTLLVMRPVINQTGGANGITRGLYVNPDLTSAADFRAIETTNGKIVFGNLPTSSAGLPTGALWNDAGTVKIV